MMLKLWATSAKDKAELERLKAIPRNKAGLKEYMNRLNSTHATAQAWGMFLRDYYWLMDENEKEKVFNSLVMKHKTEAFIEFNDDMDGVCDCSEIRREWIAGLDLKDLKQKKALFEYIGGHLYCRHGWQKLYENDLLADGDCLCECVGFLFSEYRERLFKEREE